MKQTESAVRVSIIDFQYRIFLNNKEIFILRRGDKAFALAKALAVKIKSNNIQWLKETIKI
jgi:hypothetical protein